MLFSSIQQHINNDLLLGLTPRGHLLSDWDPAIPCLKHWKSKYYYTITHHCIYISETHRDRKHQDREGMTNNNKGPLPNLKQGCFSHVQCANTVSNFFQTHESCPKMTHVTFMKSLGNYNYLVVERSQSLGKDHGHCYTVSGVKVLHFVPKTSTSYLKVIVTV